MSDYSEWNGSPRFEKFGETRRTFDDGCGKSRNGKKGRKKFKRKDKRNYDEDGDNDYRRSNDR